MCSRGAINARDLPEPVSAKTTELFFAKSAGMA
jgi:hypothetical protein